MISRQSGKILRVIKEIAHTPILCCSVDSSSFMTADVYPKHLLKKYEGGLIFFKSYVTDIFVA